MQPDPVKSLLRTQLKTMLRSITRDDRRSAGHHAASLLLATPEYQRSRCIMLFVSLPSEIDTSLVAHAAWSAGKTVAAPRVDMKSRCMCAIAIGNFADDMTKTPIGVMEPVGGEVIAPGEIDLVVVPGLGFGPSGERLGRGAGFYDRFLCDPALRAATCGYAFEQQLIAGIPMSPTDTWLQMLVTDRAIRRFAAHGSTGTS